MSKADEIRSFVIRKYIEPARARGDTKIAIRAGDVAREMRLPDRLPGIVSAIGADKFQDEARVKRLGRWGPNAGSNATFEFDLSGGRAESDASTVVVEFEPPALPQPSSEPEPDLEPSELGRSMTSGAPEIGHPAHEEQDRRAPVEKEQAAETARTPVDFPRPAPEIGRRGPEFSDGQHRDAVHRRRIKFVVEKGAMARLFKAGSHQALQAELFRLIRPSDLAGLHSMEECDSWLSTVVESDCWRPFARHSLEEDRWAYFAKLVNIVVYEIVSNRELFCESDWQRLRHWLHLPLDSRVCDLLLDTDPASPVPYLLKFLTAKEYWSVQRHARRLAAERGVPPIWFEDAWSS